MSEPGLEFERFLDELTLFVNALDEGIGRIGPRENYADVEAGGDILGDLQHLAWPLALQAEAAGIHDVAALVNALARAGARLSALDEPPVPLLGAHDAATFLRWRLAGLRAVGQATTLDARARAQAATVTAALAVAAGDGVASVAGSVVEVEAGETDDFGDLSPDEQELARSIASLDLTVRPRAPGASARVTAAPAASEANNGEASLRLHWFVVEAESDLQALGALIAPDGPGHTTQEQFEAIAQIAHKIKGAAPTVGLVAFQRVAIYLGLTMTALQNGSLAPQALLEHTLGRFLVLCETCLAAASAAASPPADVVEQARALYSSASRAAGLEPAEPGDISLPLTSAAHYASSARPISEADVTLRVGSDRLDALMIHLSALAMNRGLLVGAHGRVTETYRDMSATVDRLQRTSARIADAYPVAGSFMPSASVPDSEAADPRAESRASLLASSAARLQRLAPRDMDARRPDDVDLALRALPEIVADVATHGATLASALMSLGHLIAAQESAIVDLQQDATRMRLAPLAEFAPSLKVFASVVARESAKRVRFTLSGEMTEIDRTLLRALIEPLRQLVRNAIFHGIEKPEERRAAGKDETGLVWVRAHYVGSEVIIEVGDDGRGANAQALVTRAVRKRLLSEDEARALPIDDVWRLMFKPGMTSLDQPAEMAGSGIGLNEVATLVRALKGDIAITESSPRGTVFQIRAPMTLTAMQTIEVRIGAQAFAAPCGAVIATLDGVGRLAPREIQGHANRVGGAPPTMYLLPATAVSAAQRGAGAQAGAPVSTEVDIPAYSLAECLGVASETPPNSAFIIERHGRRLALLVDRFGPMTETMVRPLPSFLRRALIRGVTVRAEDGAIALLVDVMTLADQLLDGSARAPTIAPVRAPHSRTGARVLIVDDSVTIRRTLAQMLSRAGFAPAFARDGLEALAMMENEAPPVVVLDVEMPRLGGFELLEIMRSSERYARTRVVMLTSRASSIHERRARELGADDYLIKPSSEDALVSTVRRLLNDTEIT